MIRMVSVASAVLGVLIAASPVAAQIGPDRIPELVKNGQKVVIVDDGGRVLKGRVDSLSATGLGLATKDRRIDLSLDRIVRIDHPHDGLGNGALIGAGISVAIGLLGVGIDDHQCGPPNNCDTPAWVWPWAVASSAAVGAGIGVCIDAVIRKDPAIYRRGGGLTTSIRPAVGRGVRGAVVSVSW
jgi:hypothetical protein